MARPMRVLPPIAYTATTRITLIHAPHMATMALIGFPMASLSARVHGPMVIMGAAASMVVVTAAAAGTALETEAEASAHLKALVAEAPSGAGPLEAASEAAR